MSKFIACASAVAALTLGVALSGCSTSAGGSNIDSVKAGESAPAEIQDQLKIIEALLVSQQEAARTGLTETASGMLYAFDPEINHSVSYYSGGQSQDPIVWQEGNRSSALIQIAQMVMESAVTDVKSSSNEISFSALDSRNPSQQNPYITTFELKDGLIVTITTGDGYSSYKSKLVYKLTDEAKAAFAQSVSSEEAFPQEFQEEPPQ